MSLRERSRGRFDARGRGGCGSTEEAEIGAEWPCVRPGMLAATRNPKRQDIDSLSASTANAALWITLILAQ